MKAFKWYPLSFPYNGETSRIVLREPHYAENNRFWAKICCFSAPSWGFWWKSLSVESKMRFFRVVLNHFLMMLGTQKHHYGPKLASEKLFWLISWRWEHFWKIEKKCDFEIFSFRKLHFLSDFGRKMKDFWTNSAQKIDYFH